MGQKKDAGWLSTYLTYKSEKFIRVDIWQVAIFFRVCQVIAVGGTLLQLYLRDSWALVEEPAGSASGWGQAGRMENLSNTPGYAPLYCSNANFSYSYSADSRYEEPICEPLLAAELVAKTTDSVFFTTAVVEAHTIGWPCAAADAAAKQAACAAGTYGAYSTDAGGRYDARANGQCTCTTSRAIYPLAVEEMLLGFEHAYDTSNAKSEFAVWRGSSTDPAAAAKLDSNVSFINGSYVIVPGGDAILYPLKFWLDAADVDLDARNGFVQADATRGTHPPFRTTGVTVKVDVKYSNEGSDGKPVFFASTRKIDATIKLRAEYGTWAGMGSTNVWQSYPQAPRTTPQVFHFVERRRQGVVFQFHVSGAVYVFDWVYLLRVFIQGLVLLKVAKIATDAIVFNFLPNGQSVVLRNKRLELVSKRSEFAEIGLKAALAAATYRSFDPDNNGSIEPEDIVRIFAHVDGVGWEKAHAIAHTIMNDADTGGTGIGLSYVEYMTCLEGDAIDFPKFLKFVDPEPDAEDRELCRKAFEEERAEQDKKEKRAPMQKKPKPADPKRAAKAAKAEAKAARAEERKVAKVAAKDEKAAAKASGAAQRLPPPADQPAEASAAADDVGETKQMI